MHAALAHGTCCIGVMDRTLYTVDMQMPGQYYICNSSMYESEWISDTPAI